MCFAPHQNIWKRVERLKIPVISTIMHALLIDGRGTAKFDSGGLPAENLLSDAM
jgi:hypothetical protein